jgi:hypothetical protein
MNKEVVIKLFKKVARILEDDKQYEWLADEVKDYLNEIYVDEELEVSRSEQALKDDIDKERIRRIVINSISRIT